VSAPLPGAHPRVSRCCRAGIASVWPKPPARYPGAPAPRCRGSSPPRKRGGWSPGRAVPMTWACTRHQCGPNQESPRALSLPSRVASLPPTDRAADLRRPPITQLCCIGVFQGPSRPKPGREPALDPVISLCCQGADQTGVCAIALVPEQSTSGRCSTDESVVSTPVARRRHPILPWALDPFKDRHYRCQSAAITQVLRRRFDNPSDGSAQQSKLCIAAVGVCPVGPFAVRFAVRSPPEGDSPSRGVYR
jgi:hypothetical protein